MKKQSYKINNNEKAVRTATLWVIFFRSDQSI